MKHFFLILIFMMTLVPTAFTQGKIKMQWNGNDYYVFDTIRISILNPEQNIFIGENAGSLSGGLNNLFVGNQAGGNVTSGISNVALGEQALFHNTIKSYLVAIGDSALFANGIGASGEFEGRRNVAIGSKALCANNTGHSNTAIGYHSLWVNTSANHNTGVGNETLLNNTTGYSNTCLGTQSLYHNNTGNENTGVGGSTLLYNDTGSSNVAVGQGAMTNNQTGSFNTTVGRASLLHNETGDYNVIIGSEAFYTSTTISNSVALGHQAGFSSNGSGNVFIGYRAGYNETTAHNLYIDNDSTSSPLIYGDFIDNELNINGRQGINKKEPETDLHIKQSNVITERGIRLEYGSDNDYWDTYIDGANDYNFGFNSVLKAYINDSDGSYNIASDRRLKSSILPVERVLPSVLLLNPSTYYYTADQNQKKQIGLIAQEVEFLFPEAVNEKDGYKAINYAVFGILAVQAIKEQQTLLDDQAMRIEKLEKQMARLMQHIQDQ